MARRRAAIEISLAQADCDHLVFCGANRFGSIVQWLTQWPVTAEAVGLFTPGERDALFVQYVNHAPQARILADKADVAGVANPRSLRPLKFWSAAAHDRIASRQSDPLLPSSTRFSPPDLENQRV